jgi:hypothetical protein
MAATVFTRFLLALLLAAFALPAPVAAACHGGAGATTSHHPSPAPDEPEAVHACIGCIPPAGLDAPHTGLVLLAADLRPPASVPTFDLGRHGPPDLPPPRQG